MIANYSKLRLSEYDSGRLFISFYISKKRYRFSNGDALGSDIKPNLFSGESKHLEGLWKDGEFIK